MYVYRIFTTIIKIIRTLLLLELVPGGVPLVRGQLLARVSEQRVVLVHGVQRARVPRHA